MSIGKSFNSDNWHEALEEAYLKDAAIGKKKEEGKTTYAVFKTLNDMKIEGFETLSLNKIQKISKDILNSQPTELKNPKELQKSYELHRLTEAVINKEITNQKATIRKIYPTALEIFKWITLYSGVFTTVGLSVQALQYYLERSASKEIKKSEKLLKDLNVQPQELKAWAENTASKLDFNSPDEKGFARTNPAMVFKSLLSGEQIDLTPKPLYDKENVEGKFISVPEQIKKDLTRCSRLTLNHEVIYSNTSETRNAYQAYHRVLDALNETPEDHPLTESVMVSLTQAMLADLSHALITPPEVDPENPDEMIHHFTKFEDTSSEINISDTHITLEIKALVYDKVAGLSLNPENLRVVSRKFEIPIDELKQAIHVKKEIELQNPKDPKNIKKIQDEFDTIFKNLKSQDLVSEPLFSRESSDLNEPPNILNMGVTEDLFMLPEKRAYSLFNQIHTPFRS